MHNTRSFDDVTVNTATAMHRPEVSSKGLKPNSYKQEASSGCVATVRCETCTVQGGTTRCTSASLLSASVSKAVRSASCRSTNFESASPSLATSTSPCSRMYADRL